MQTKTILTITLFTIMGGAYFVPTRLNSYLSDINTRLIHLNTLYEPPVASQRIISAYNVGIEGQNDSSPCIGASNINLCDYLTTHPTTTICAANFVPLYTTLHIPSLSLDCLVLDRTSTLYSDRVDLAFPPTQYQEALNFGLKTLEVSYKLPSN